MSKRQDFETRLRAYLARGANRPAPSGIERRILSEAPVRTSWPAQVLAAAAILALALGLGMVFQNLRSHSRVAPIVSPSAKPSLPASPSPSPSPTASTGFLALSSLHMTSVTTGWATGDTSNTVYGETSAVYRTSDGANHWTRVSPSDSPVREAFFLSDSQAWFVDARLSLHRTGDGGKTWQLLAGTGFPPGSDGTLDFVDAGHGWRLLSLGAATGSQGVAIYRTLDGGMSWEQISVTMGPGGDSTVGSLPFDCDKGPLGFLDASTGWAPGECAGGKPFFYVTHDGGRTWRDANLPLPAAIAAGCACATGAPVFSSPQDGVFLLSGAATGGNVSLLYVTHDAGASWSAEALPGAKTGGVAFVFSGILGWLVDSDTGGVYATEDGGQHWRTLSTIQNVTNVPILDFVNQKVGYALRGPGKLPMLVTTDGGRSWSEIQITL